MSEAFQIIIDSAVGSFLQVGVFVAVTLLLFNYLKHKTGGKLITYISNAKKLQPLIGALMGVIPGCGSAIVMMPLYTRNVVTFGTVVATLIATVGDASFVLISQKPLQAVYVHTISIVVAIISGYLIDFLKLEPAALRELREKQKGKALLKQKTKQQQQSHHTIRTALSLHPAKKKEPHHISNSVIKSFYKVWWAFALIGLVLGINLLFQKTALDWYPGFDFDLFIGLVGTVISLAIYIAGKRYFADDTLEGTHTKHESKKNLFIHSTFETSFVTTWVFVAFVAYELTLFFLGIDLVTVVNQVGIFAVIAAALIGLIPGCGPQIVTVTAYTQGIIPFSAVVANAISQDGDALFPLIAVNKHAAIWATLYTTVPALIIGIGLFLLGF